MKIFKQLAFIAALGGGVWLFANTDWDTWKSQTQTAFQEGLPPMTKSAQAQERENMSAEVNDQIVKIVAAIQELQQINQRLEELTSILNQGYGPQEAKEALAEAKVLMLDRIVIYKGIMRECPILKQDNEDVYRINVRGEQSLATAPMMKAILEEEAFKRINAELF